MFYVLLPPIASILAKQQIDNFFTRDDPKVLSWRDIAVTSNATCLKTVQNNNIFFVSTPLWHVLCNLKEQPEIYPKTAIPSMHSPIKQTVHILDTSQFRQEQSLQFLFGCSMLSRSQYFLYIRLIIRKSWSWRDISVTSNATCLKIVPNNNIFFVHIPLWQGLCNQKERPEIYPEIAIPSMHWPIKQILHIRDFTI